MENVACILRNLSYRLENEIDPQEGADDVLDREWEIEQRREIEELDRSLSKSAPGCLAFLSRPRNRDNRPRLSSLSALNRPMYSVDYANPGGWAWPRHHSYMYMYTCIYQYKYMYEYMHVHSIHVLVYVWIDVYIKDIIHHSPMYVHDNPSHTCTCT